MKKSRDQHADAVELRRRAEERLRRQRPEGGEQSTEVEMMRLIHEMQVHQIELEMQNDELQQARAQVEALLGAELQQSRAQVEALLAQYTDLYDFAPTGYLTLDRDGAIRRVNLTGARLLGVEPSGLVNRRFGLFVAEADRLAFSDFLQKVFAGQAKESCEVMLPQEGSQPLVVYIEGTRSADGQECRAVVIDITERKRAEQDLARQHQLLGVINHAQKHFITTPDTWVAFDRLLSGLLALTESEYGFIGDVLFTAEGLPYLKTCAITNVAWNEAMRSFYEKNSPNGIESFNLKTLFGAALTSSEPVIANDPRHDPRLGDLPEGHPLLNAFLGIPIRAGNKLVAIVGIANRPGGYDQSVIGFLQPLLATIGQMVEARRRDLERTRVEEALRESEERFRQIAESTEEWIWEVNSDGLYTYENFVVEKILGYKPEEIVGKKHFYDFFLSDKKEQMKKEAFEVFAAKGEFIKYVNSNVHKNGSIVILETSGVPIWDSRGGILGYRGVDTDITDRKKAEERLLEYQAKLRAMASEILRAEDRERKHLAIGLHDNICQRLVLTKLAVESSLPLVSNAKLAASLRIAAAAIGETIEEADSLTFELSSPVLREFGLVPALEKYLAEEIRRKHQIAYELESDEGGGALSEETKSCLFRVMRELLMNAVKHARANKIKVSVRRSQCQLRLSVCDDGIGFKREEVDWEASKKTRFGLFSVREQLEYLGGSLEVESEPGRGTTATVVVPLPEKTVV